MLEKENNFYPRDAMHKRGLCCRRVSLLHAGIVSKRVNLSQKCFDHLGNSTR